MIYILGNLLFVTEESRRYSFMGKTIFDDSIRDIREMIGKVNFRRNLGKLCLGLMQCQCPL